MGSRFQTVASMAFFKTLLMVFNFGFWVTGIIILAIGIWMKVELHKYMEVSAGFSSKAPYVLMATGAIIFLCGALACCCTVKGQAILLYTYGVFLTIIFMVELGAAISIYAYRNQLQEGFDKGLNQSITNYHKAGRKQTSDDLDIMQEKLQCCGNKNFQDWTRVPDGQVPPSCCKEKFCDPSDEKEIYTQGCYTKVVEFLNSNIGLVAGTAVAVAFFPLFGVLLSCCLAMNIRKVKYEQMA